MKHLGIDYGEKRVGLAISDDGGKMAFGFKTLNRDILPSRDQFFSALLTTIEQESIQALVIGMPISLNGQDADNLTCRRVRNLIKSLKRRVSLPIFVVNEALSSNEAESRLMEVGLRGQKLKDKLDAEAAAVILQQFLNLNEEQRIPYEPE